MATEGEVDFWSATVQAFAPLQLGNPELTPKLLKRPPFRFIHDIVTSINARFAAYDHIFRPDQLDASCIDSKEKKIEYLTTLVEYISSLLGKKVDVNVKKIVSGSEPERTNTFLQCLAMAVGYAQQDKAKKNQGAQSAESSRQQTADGKGARASTREKVLVDTTSSEQKWEDSERALEKVKLSQESTNFFEKLSAFGQFHLDEQTSVKDMGESIVAMYKELQNDTAETQPTPLPQEALETAIKRQLESVQKLQALEEENREILNKLMVLLT
ncbi:Microtubule-binding protein MIP-T3, putative [Trypanosoma equiperdum]|nr:hypothetical protein, conserved [Trypanosoma brucei gambiense DAL972]RHW68173.1 Microtubule-binding protein MIP-T3 [Trypanosoma brucei equiperdum]CBH18528.1 hypothetical protein, conserved [Trypanosoma brucei gambiense DAL972]SCU67798.1 Microtubule-binding protein MIP-T3, putative [Trypanosoma equiperdum]|eukprot:XP_011780792.1 hypothetical protein, conserved [Trypanosoma brucei gambiense DAL972]